MRFELPDRLGPFAINERGQISPRTGEDLPRFLFHWRGCKVSAHLEYGRLDHGDSMGKLRLSACIGRVPSSADIVTGERRAASFATLRGLFGAVPAGWRLRLLADHRVGLETELDISWPTSAVALMAAITGFLLAMAPYLDLLQEEAVLEPANTHS